MIAGTRQGEVQAIRTKYPSKIPVSDECVRTQSLSLCVCLYTSGVTENQIASGKWSIMRDVEMERSSLDRFPFGSSYIDPIFLYNTIVILYFLNNFLPWFCELKRGDLIFCFIFLSLLPPHRCSIYGSLYIYIYIFPP